MHEAMQPALHIFWLTVSFKKSLQWTASESKILKVLSDEEVAFKQIWSRNKEVKKMPYIWYRKVEWIEFSTENKTTSLL